jgi:hypothetical protein
MVKFSTDLWDGFDICSAKTEQGLQVAKDIIEFLKKRAELEQEYAKKLATLCKSPPGSSGFFGGKGPTPVEKETKTLKAALLCIQEEGARISTHHLEYSNKLQNDVIKPLEAFVKAKDPERRKVVTEGQKRVKALNDAKATADKSKDAYQRAMKEAEAAAEAHAKAQKDLQGASDNKRFQEAEKRASQRVGPLTDKAKQAEATYQKSVEQANELQRSTYQEHLPPIMDTMQQLEEERFAALRSALQEYLSGQRAIPGCLEERCNEMDRHISAIDHESDLLEFCDSHRSDSSEPDPIPFVPYKDRPDDKPPEKLVEKPDASGPKDKEKKDAATADPPAKQEEDLFS